MKIALIALSSEGALVAKRLGDAFPLADMYVHESVPLTWETTRFTSVMSLTRDLFGSYEGLVYIAPCGVVVRAIAPNIRHKTEDPAVVVMDVCARWAVSLLSGHEGGANDLAIDVANITGAEPVISTTTEAVKNLIVGVGCRRGTESDRILGAIRAGLKDAGCEIDHVRLIASADIKSDEEGLKEAARELGVRVRFIPSDDIRSTPLDFEHSDFVVEKVNVPAVAEPAALLAGRRTRLILNKKNYNGVTVSIARESCWW